MLGDVFRWTARLSVQLVVWVFVLSIKINGLTLFDHIHDVVVDNEVVEAADKKIEDLWEKVYHSVSIAIDDRSEKPIEAEN